MELSHVILIGFFFTILMMGCLSAFIYIGRVVSKRDEYYSQQIARLNEDLSDIRGLFNNEIKEVLAELKSITKSEA